MREKPVLVIMAAGMGSRYGGLKQIDPVDDEGNIIIDFSLFDAREAGFETVVFIIKKEIEEAFKEKIGNRISGFMKVIYVYQEPGACLPEDIPADPERTKPWGTGHAILCCRDVIHGPFAVINADDYYGKHAFRTIYRQLLCAGDGEKYAYSMVGYRLGNTLTESGYVSRGICCMDAEGYLTEVTERVRIEKHGSTAAYTEDNGKTWTELPEETVVSMNLWGFTESILTELADGFRVFLQTEAKKEPAQGGILFTL
jgi:choline kinase